MPSNLQLLPKFKEKLSYLYIEHAVIEKESQSIVIFNNTDAETSVTQVPVCDLALLMLGPGTKISHAAIDVISRNNCLILWTGEEGVRLYAFGTGGTHSSERLLKQAKLACDPKLRLEVSRKLYGLRFPDALDPAVTIEQLRGKEGYRVRNLYQTNATKYGIAWEGRSYDRNQWQGSDAPNRALSAANACLYGICHAAILSLGFSPALGFIHTGKQLSFVYDLADLYKMELSVPVAFEQASLGIDDIDRRVRIALRDKFKETQFLATIVHDLQLIFGPDESDTEKYDSDPSLPGQINESAPGGVLYCKPE